MRFSIENITSFPILLMRRTFNALNRPIQRLAFATGRWAEAGCSPFLVVSCTLVMMALSSCITSSYSYKSTVPIPRIESTIVVKAPKDTVWSRIVRGVASTFFVINNMDRQSGFLNVSYSGDPEDYVEGGEVTVEFDNGDRDYTFPGSRAYVHYSFFTRRVKMDGRMNIQINEIDSEQVLISINVRYILNMTIEDNYSLYAEPYHQSISFDTNGSAKSRDGGTFFSNGRFEQTVLNLAKGEH